MVRHRQKDEEIGVEGYGILNTRKRMWKDAEGNIVAKKPAISRDNVPVPDTVPFDSGLPGLATNGTEEQAGPISPPLSHDPSLGLSSLDDHDSGIVLGYNSALDVNENPLLNSDHLSPINQAFWSSNIAQHEPGPDAFVTSSFDDAPFDDIFNADTASSFNNPFTTMSNYNWLFDLDLPRQTPLNAVPIMEDPLHSLNYQGHAIPHTSHIFEIQLDHMSRNKSSSTYAQHGSLSSHRTGSPQQLSPSAAQISPPLADEELRPSQDQEMQALPPQPDLDCPATPLQRNKVQQSIDLERPLSMLCPSRSLPIIDELARQQVLDLIDTVQPVAPDGSLVMRNHPLLSMSCLQMYCDLFFTRFNSTYPLIHMSTFEPSHVDTLLLAAVLLLGATYGEKDAHQLAVRARLPRYMSKS
jgi:hypothetical protein